MDLKGCRVLVVEDEYFAAREISDALLAVGAEVIGPVNSIGEAMRALDSDQFSLALLDINLGGDMIYPLVDEIRSRGIPCLFASGYGCDAVPSDYRRIACFDKPFEPAKLVQAVANSRFHTH